MALNDVLMEGMPLHPLEEQRESVNKWRQIGLGIMGLADMLIKMGIRYGSPEAIELCDNIGQTMAHEALFESNTIARTTQGRYPMFDAEAISESEYFNRHYPAGRNVLDDAIRQEIFRTGLANSQLLTIPPCGSIATMLGISGGIEPIYANYYTRKTESLHGHDEYYKVYTPIVQEYMDKHGLTDDSQLPDYFVTAQNLDFKERVDMQAVWQSHIDASISSTVNVSNSFTVEQVGELYMYAWEKGLKGVTLYRDGCKRGGILTTDTTKTDKIEAESAEKAPEIVNKRSTLSRGEIIKVNNDCVGKKRTLNTGCGTLHCTAFFDPHNGNLLETYFSKGSSGGCAISMTGMSRLISLASRGGIDIYDIVDQLKSAGTCPAYAVRTATKHDTSRGSSCPVAIGNALIEMYEEMQASLDGKEDAEYEKVMPAKQKIEQEAHPLKCPQCGGNLVFEGGCNTCKDCGWSKCD